MKGILRRVASAALPLAALALAAPRAIPAEEMYREFYGRIDQIDKKKMIVDNRMGDKVSFIAAAHTEVVDARAGEKGKEKAGWDDLKKSDWVTVSWKMIDKPRVAYKVKVMPPKEEPGEDL